MKDRVIPVFMFIKDPRKELDCFMQGDYVNASEDVFVSKQKNGIENKSYRKSLAGLGRDVKK